MVKRYRIQYFVLASLVFSVSCNDNGSGVNGGGWSQWDHVEDAHVEGLVNRLPKPGIVTMDTGPNVEFRGPNPLGFTDSALIDVVVTPGITGAAIIKGFVARDGQEKVASRFKGPDRGSLVRR